MLTKRRRVVDLRQMDTASGASPEHERARVPGGFLYAPIYFLRRCFGSRAPMRAISSPSSPAILSRLPRPSRRTSPRLPRRNSLSWLGCTPARLATVRCDSPRSAMATLIVDRTASMLDLLGGLIDYSVPHDVALSKTRTSTCRGHPSKLTDFGATVDHRVFRQKRGFSVCDFSGTVPEHFLRFVFLRRNVAPAYTRGFGTADRYSAGVPSKNLR